MNYKVYVYTNKINGKKYVGQTSRTFTAEASRETGIDRSYISDTCKGKYKKAKGYKFMYENDYISNS